MIKSIVYWKSFIESCNYIVDQFHFPNEIYFERTFWARHNSNNAITIIELSVNECFEPINLKIFKIKDNKRKLVYQKDNPSEDQIYDLLMMYKSPNEERRTLSYYLCCLERHNYSTYKIDFLDPNCNKIIIFAYHKRMNNLQIEFGVDSQTYKVNYVSITKCDEEIIVENDEDLIFKALDDAFLG